MTDAEIGKELALITRAYVENALAPLRSRLAILEARPTLEYQGTWNAEKLYAIGSFVTWGGGMWHAQVPTKGDKPGLANSPGSLRAWKLCVKGGSPARDGKDSKDLR